MDDRAIRAALDALPSTCRYHADIDGGPHEYRFSGACCATGEPALLRRRAHAALDRVVGQIARGARVG